MHLYDYDEEKMTEAQAKLWNEAIMADEVAKDSWNELVNMEDDDPMLRERYEEKLDESVEAIQKFEEAMKA